MRKTASVVALCVCLGIGAIVPSASAARGASGALPDLWSGIWPVQIMSAAGTSPLGTLTWRPISYEEGISLVGRNFGGRPFVGCADDGRTRFFRGHYAQGSDLVACTKGDDGKVLIGRFNGMDEFRSGSFEIVIQAEGPRLFVGDYFEDDGVTTRWCGVLERALVSTGTTEVEADLTPPSLRVGAPFVARAGSTLGVQMRVVDARSASAQADLTVLRGSTALVRVNVPVLRADGTPRLVRWRIPRSVRGVIRICVAAIDDVGNASTRVCRSLKVS